MTENLRLFFAVQLESDFHQAVSKLITQLRKESWGHRIRWTRPENLHLTLRFIGRAKPSVVPLLTDITLETIKSISPFIVETNSVHIFPSLDKPYVVALKIMSNNALVELAEKIEEGSVAAGFKREKRNFLPHITLGRVAHRPVVINSEKYCLENNNFKVDKFFLLNSEKNERGNFYVSLKEFKF